MEQISIDDIKRITLEEIQGYISSKYKYKTKIEEDELVIEYQKKSLKIEIRSSDEYTCYNDYKWISINYINKKSLCGHCYGFAAKDFDYSIIDDELKNFEE